MALGTVSTSLQRLRAGVVHREGLLVAEWTEIVAWAADHTVSSRERAATIGDGRLDTGLPIAGAGAPWVSELALVDLLAVLDRPADRGRLYVGRVLECAWRLPGVHAAVVGGRLAPWRAEQVAARTRPLSVAAAGFVDAALRELTSAGWDRVEDLVVEAVLRCEPERAERERVAAADARDVQVGAPDGHDRVVVDAVLAAADARALDVALDRRAYLLRRAGSTASLDVRRSMALGALARRDLLRCDLDEDDREQPVAVPGDRHLQVLAPPQGQRADPQLRVERGTGGVQGVQAQVLGAGDVEGRGGDVEDLVEVLAEGVGELAVLERGDGAADGDEPDRGAGVGREGQVADDERADPEAVVDVHGDRGGRVRPRGIGRGGLQGDLATEQLGEQVTDLLGQGEVDGHGGAPALRGRCGARRRTPPG
ncbi:hypothetical protein [Pimelobacter sp. 30-1]|uniref:hypothetical protein n=1 Tax=Pimelobacter sp. 30-1 TaxID=2004991 RepID=UPI001C050951|nr:hypothetical protein [Pimelobacter sp. 30-1]